MKHEFGAWPTGLLVTWLTLCIPSSGSQTIKDYTSRYSPYRDGTAWPEFPTTRFVETDSNVWTHPSKPTEHPTLQEVVEPGADHTTVRLTLPTGGLFKTHNEPVLGPGLSQVYSGDFNQDGKPDFLAIKPSSGNGLAGDLSFGLFAFSTKHGFIFARVKSMRLGPEDLVMDPASNTFRFIHTAFRNGVASDGRSHSFWVHRFFEWQDGRFQLDERLQPVWIQFLHRENHEPTKLLTPALKKKIWLEEVEARSETDLESY